MFEEVTGSAAMAFLATRPTMIITTQNESLGLNAGVFGSWTNLSLREIGAAVSTQSDTYANMRRTGEFVVNIPGAGLVEKLALLAEALPPLESEVERAGLTQRPPITGQTPSIAECAAAVEFAFSREVEVGHHSFMIGRCRAGWIRGEFRDNDGRIDIFKAKVVRSFKYPLPLYHLPGEVLEG